MAKFRITIILFCLLIYLMTYPAIYSGGIDFLTPYFIGISELTWQSQINVDFGMYLSLSAIWISWRSGFSRNGYLLAIFGAPLGMLFFAPYLVYLAGKHRNDFRGMILGVHAAASGKNV